MNQKTDIWIDNFWIHLIAYLPTDNCHIMISKEYRLTERELRKVLSRKKPFFSYIFIANTLTNKAPHGRCGILLSSKCAKGSVNRNFWRRMFYDMSLSTLLRINMDVVVVPKKWTVLDHKNQETIAEFQKNILFLYKKIEESLVSH